MSSNQRKKYKQLKTEFVGIDSSGFLPAKCFHSSLAPSAALHVGLKGIARLWDKFGPEDGVIETDFVDLRSNAHSELFDLLLRQWLKKFNNDLNRFLKPLFRSKQENLPYMMGSVDLIEAEKNLENCNTLFKCNFTDLTFGIQELMLMKDCYKAIHKTLLAETTEASKLLSEVARGLYLLKHIPDSVNPIANAKLVRVRIHRAESYKDTWITGMPIKLAGLRELAAFSCDYILSRSKGMSGSSLGFNGLVFNLNYLMERVLNKAMESVGGHKDLTLFVNGHINSSRIENDQGDAFRKFMRPDCFGVIAKEPKSEAAKQAWQSAKGAGYILDAKHKFFYTGSEELERIERLDFYQIVSYSRTHYHVNSLPAFYGLVGLDFESEVVPAADLRDGRYINYGANGSPNRVALARVDYRANGSREDLLKIVQIPLKFAQFLFDIGNAMDEEEQERIFIQLGRDIIATFLSALAPREDAAS